MPMYEYKCKKCGHRFEKIEKFSSKVNKKCPQCKKSAVERLISSSAIQFKGTGWYVTDYAGKNSSKEEPKSSSTETASESVKTSDKPAAEEKPKEKKKESTESSRTESSRTESQKATKETKKK